MYLIITRICRQRICSTCRKTSRSFPHSWFITGFVTRVARRVPLVEQESLTLQEHLSSPPVFSGVRVTRSLVFCVMFFRSLFVHFLSAVVLSVLPFTDSDCPFWYLQTLLKLHVHGYIYMSDRSQLVIKIDSHLHVHAIQYMPTPTCMNVITFINIK